MGNRRYSSIEGGAARAVPSLGLALGSSPPSCLPFTAEPPSSGATLRRRALRSVRTTEASVRWTSASASEPPRCSARLRAPAVFGPRGAGVVAVAVLLTLGCASGVVRVSPDGSCEVRGVALGRAELIAMRPGSTDVDTEDPNTATHNESGVCGKINGGTGSATWYALLGAAIGAAVAILPGVL